MAEHWLGASVRIPDVPVRSGELKSFANQLGRLIWHFNIAVNRALIAYREPILDLQLIRNGSPARPWTFLHRHAY
jgi:hypothetical protein